MERGKAAFAFASGLAATRAVMTLLEAGDHVVVTDNTYGGTYRLFERVLRKGGLDFTYVDTSDLDATAAAFQPNTKMLFVETPTNPVLRITDLAAVSPLRARPRRGRGGGQHVCQPLRAAADRVRRRPRAAQHHQVPERPQRQRRRHRGERARRPHRLAAGSCRTPKAPSWGRWTRGWCCAAPRRCPSAWSATTPTPSASPGSWPTHPKVTLRPLPRPARPPAARARQAADARLRRPDRLCPRVARARRAPLLEQRAADVAGREPRRRGNAHQPPGVA